MTLDPRASDSHALRRSDWDHHWTRARSELERARSALDCCSCRPHLELAQLHIQSLKVALESETPAPRQAIRNVWGRES